jgi:hypothetical protein
MAEAFMAYMYVYMYIYGDMHTHNVYIYIYLTESWSWSSYGWSVHVYTRIWWYARCFQIRKAGTGTEVDPSAKWRKKWNW